MLILVRAFARAGNPARMITDQFSPMSLYLYPDTWVFGRMVGQSYPSVATEESFPDLPRTHQTAGIRRFFLSLSLGEWKRELWLCRFLNLLNNFCSWIKRKRLTPRSPQISFIREENVEGKTGPYRMWRPPGENILLLTCKMENNVFFSHTDLLQCLRVTMSNLWACIEKLLDSWIQFVIVMNVFVFSMSVGVNLPPPPPPSVLNPQADIHFNQRFHPQVMCSA